MNVIVKLIRTITGIDPKRNINPDEAVCLGAGIWAGILDGKIAGMEVMSSLQAAVFRAVLEAQNLQEEQPKISTRTTTTDEQSDIVTQAAKNPTEKIPVKPINDSLRRRSVFKSLRSKK